MVALSEEIRQMDNPGREVIKPVESQPDHELSLEVIHLFTFDERMPSPVKNEIKRRVESDETIKHLKSLNVASYQVLASARPRWSESWRNTLGFPLKPDDQAREDLRRHARDEIQARAAEADAAKAQITQDVVREYLQYFANPLSQGSSPFEGDNELPVEWVIRRRALEEVDVKASQKKIDELETEESLRSSWFKPTRSLADPKYVDRINVNELLDSEKVELEVKLRQAYVRIAQKLLAGGIAPNNALSRAEEPHSDAERGLSRTDVDE